MDDKDLLFTISAEDFDWQFFRSSGHGGQHKNKRDTACRCIHRASNSVGISTDERSQWQNKKLAFLRCVNTDKFKLWHKIETGKYLLSLEEKRKIELMIDNELQYNTKIEVKDLSGKWIDENQQKDDDTKDDK